MDFKSIVNSLDMAQSRTDSVQSEIRPLWIDKYGQNFVELVLGDLQEDIKCIAGTTEEAVNQQMKNNQSRQHNHDYIASVSGRDAAQQSSNQQLDSQIGTLSSDALATIPETRAIFSRCQALQSEIAGLSSRIDAAMSMAN